MTKLEEITLTGDIIEAGVVDMQAFHNFIEAKAKFTKIKTTQTKDGFVLDSNTSLETVAEYVKIFNVFVGVRNSAIESLDEMNKILGV